jgi:hypothetical protein
MSTIYGELHLVEGVGEIAEAGVDVLEFLYFGKGRSLEVKHQTLVAAQLPHQLIIVFALEAE